MGDRIGNRRQEDEQRYLYFDRFPTTTFVLILSLLSLTLIDGVLTLRLLEEHFVEANPVMHALLQRGPVSFILGKYALTVFGLPFLLIFGRRQVFLPCLRVGHVLPAAVGLYLLLLSYQIRLIITF
ncbi:DUF5658 family protein [Paludisphaera mucosa]|uniref:DUF5658 family protein n=1 Tax=Paludisphaera mucosa TaxID=3030827 RepID=A0ABT6FJE7_9BACT|nr:DUF5658 family protein [Paludisphaera mucosa]